MKVQRQDGIGAFKELKENLWGWWARRKMAEDRAEKIDGHGLMTQGLPYPFKKFKMYSTAMGSH